MGIADILIGSDESAMNPWRTFENLEQARFAEFIF
jgi:hypothetical protein